MQGISSHWFFKWLVDRRSAGTGDRANGIPVSSSGKEHHVCHWGLSLLNDGTARVDVDLFLISPQGATLGRARQEH